MSMLLLGNGVLIKTIESLIKKFFRKQKYTDISNLKTTNELSNNRGSIMNRKNIYLFGDFSNLSENKIQNIFALLFL